MGPSITGLCRELTNVFATTMTLGELPFQRKQPLEAPTLPAATAPEIEPARRAAAAVSPEYPVEIEHAPEPEEYYAPMEEEYMEEP
jgi:hypothetical protein